ncbi:hypothetical protein BDY19DRAFT_306135 [Irpex rosettiformis]|uniref:Uncharacterized protein n=1 Tax=Irpex rosettiformis TaxID=378272 RepID=A0ACB8TYK8_9APHY|nr:hypothetical protein BDY19DRAFT_306135 [Irpex rosettiformis]
MALTFLQKLQFAWNRFLLEFIPPPHARKSLTWQDVPAAFAYMLLYGFMAYLVRRRDTQLGRLLLLPSIIYLAIRGVFYYDFSHPDYMFHNWCRGLMGLSLIARSIDFAFARQGVRKAGEKQLPAVHETIPKPSNTQSVTRFLPHWASEAIEVSTTLRWIGWELGKGVSIPPDTRPKERSAFLKATFWRFIKNLLVVDILLECIKSYPGIGSPIGGTLFLPGLPPLQRYTLSTVITIISGTAMIAAFHAIQYFGTLIAVGLLGQSPELWPPLMNNPWASDSISDLWAKRWHQMLRRVFLVYGGIPGGWIAGRPGFILGTFFASGLLHECSIYVLGRGMDHRVTFFFTFQGVCVLLEVLWYKVTGRKVRGWGGRLWTFLIVLTTGQACLDAWFMRGLGGSRYISWWMSPAQMIIFPIVHQLIAALR